MNSAGKFKQSLASMGRNSQVSGQFANSQAKYNVDVQDHTSPVFQSKAENQRWDTTPSVYEFPKEQT